MSSLAESQTPSLSNLLTSYDLFLLDAYGVLVSHNGVLPGAISWIQALKSNNKEYLVLTNDASKLRETAVSKYLGWGLALEESRILNSGMLLEDFFRENTLHGAKTIVLGTPDSETMASIAGADVVPLDVAAEPDVLVVADDEGFVLEKAISDIISMLFRLIDKNKCPRLVLCNPDLIYPSGPERFSIAAGSIANLIEGALELRYSAKELKFVRLGKPYEPIYRKAIGDVDKRKVLMIGDQLQTDILGANTVGVDSLLLTQGVSKKVSQSSVQPTFVAQSLGDLI